jgi:hypothetical protein
MKPGNWCGFKPPRPPRQGRAGTTGEAQEHIPGTWRVIDRAPGGYWLQPSTPSARAWAADHPDRLVSGCILATGRELETAAYGFEKP